MPQQCPTPAAQGAGVQEPCLQRTMPGSGQERKFEEAGDKSGKEVPKLNRSANQVRWWAPQGPGTHRVGGWHVPGTDSLGLHVARGLPAELCWQQPCSPSAEAAIGPQRRERAARVPRDQATWKGLQWQGSASTRDQSPGGRVSTESCQRGPGQHILTLSLQKLEKPCTKFKKQERQK